MKNGLNKSVIAIALLGSVVAFSTPAFADSETLGTLGGAAAGGLIGSQFGKGGGNIAATVGGVIAGGVIGNAIGRDSDESRYDNNYGQPAYQPAPQQGYSYYQSPPPVVYTAPAPVYYAPPPTVVYEQPATVVYERPYYGRHYRYYRPYYGY